MEHIIGDLGTICLILTPFFLILGIGGWLFETAVDRFPAFRHLLERVFDIDLSNDLEELDHGL